MEAAYKRILHSLERLPPSSVYRQSAESITKQRLEIVAKNQDLNAIESQINAGQVEELLLQANAEFELVQEMLDSRVFLSLTA